MMDNVHNVQVTYLNVKYAPQQVHASNVIQIMYCKMACATKDYLFVHNMLMLPQIILNKLLVKHAKIRKKF